MKELVGELEGELAKGIETLVKEEAGYSLDQFRSSQLGLVPELPVRGLGQVKTRR